MRPLVAIILVNFNGMKDTIDCIKSLKLTDYDNQRIIVVDNGSTEEVTDFEKEYIKTETCYIETGANLGFSGGNNIGIKMAQSMNADYIMLLNNDTVVNPSFISELVNVAETRKDAGIVCGKIYWYDDPDTIWYAGGSFDRVLGITSHERYNMVDDQHENYVKEVTFATGCLWLMPKSTVDLVGLMDEEFFLYSEDDDYCCRVINAGLKIYYVNSAIIYHKVSKSTCKMSERTQYYLIRNGLYIISKYSTKKIYAYLKRLVLIAKRIKNGQYHVSPTVKAINHFMRGVRGKI